jgi:hypothetical protein
VAIGSKISSIALSIQRKCYRQTPGLTTKYLRAIRARQRFPATVNSVDTPGLAAFSRWGANLSLALPDRA